MTSNRPSRAQTWAARADALAGRATYKWAAGCAAVSLAAFLLAAGILLTGALYWPGADIVRILASLFLGPLALTGSLVVLSHRSGRLSAPEALFTVAAAVPAWGLAATAAVSWSAGFTAADAGVPLSWFEAAALPLLALAVVAGAAALLPTVNSLWSPRRSLAYRSAQSLLLAAPAALALLVLFLVAYLLAPLAAAGLLFVALKEGSAERSLAGYPSKNPADPHPRGPWPTGRRPADARPAEPVTRFPTSRSSRTAVVVIAGGTLIFGLLCIVFAVSGSTWSDLATDSTAAMNLGLAAGALNAVVLTAAVGMVLLPRVGGVLHWTVLLVSGGLLSEAAAQFAGVGHPWQWPLTLIGGILLGFGFVLPLAQLVPGPPLLRLSAALGGGLAAAFIGVIVVSGAGFIAPLVSAALLVWCFWPQDRQPAVLRPA
ncbi:hypothetical protein MUG94_01280 [Arthrobacter gengyunqii]|uniref:Uncharacterized protein n=1 Tax=Arthrobacter gengyunqii TaxID=2886940 RepID=A0A9X1S7W5_9MICC|nr:hypothetical protein [Arthrobacter gengyunqii]MCC3270851.1 hypothetical protein [Arthrobacter gengyunqii]UOY96457.1 hypothetical protein MUG94_01280 [Arthrobacter gengyunqii]